MNALEQIRSDVAELTTLGGRLVGTEGHTSAKRYLVERLEGVGLPPYLPAGYEISYARRELNFTNVVAQILGADSALAPIVLGAHYDTFGDLPGADDNAAAVAVCLAVAERLKETPFERSIVFAFFDGEEPPFFLQPEMGSIRFFEDHVRDRVHCAIVMDLVGHDVPIPGLEDLLILMGMESDPVLSDVVVASEPSSGVRIVPTLNEYVGDMSDHHVFRVNQVPYLLLTCGRWEHYHRETDTLDKVNFSKIAATADYVVELLRRVSSARFEGPFTGNDTTSVELDFLKRNVEPALKAAGAGITLETRANIDLLVEMLMRYGL